MSTFGLLFTVSATIAALEPSKMPASLRSLISYNYISFFLFSSLIASSFYFSLSLYSE